MKQFFQYSLALLFAVISFSCLSGKSLQSKVQVLEKKYTIWHSGMGRTRGIDFEIQYELDKQYPLNEAFLLIGSHDLPLKIVERDQKKWLIGDYNQLRPEGHEVDFAENEVFNLAPFSDSKLRLYISDKQVEIPLGSFTRLEPKNLIP